MCKYFRRHTTYSNVTRTNNAESLLSEEDPVRIGVLAGRILRPLALLALICVPAPVSGLRAQDADVLTRDGDQNVRTLDERESVLTLLLAEAQRLQAGADLSAAARLLNRAAWLQLRLNRSDDAIATYRRVLAIGPALGNAAIRVDALDGSAEVYANLGKCDQAEPLLDQALKLSEQNNYAAGRAEVLLTLAACQDHRDHKVSLKTATESLALWKSVNHHWGMAKAYSAIGHYQLAQNSLIDSAASHEAALALFKELGIVDEQAEELINLGFVEYRKGNWQDSMQFLTQAQSMIDEKAEPDKMGQVTVSIGEAFIESGLPQAGLDKLNQALVYFERSQNILGVIIVRWDMGRCHYLMANHQEALVALNAALTDAVRIKDRALEAMCHDYLGRTYEANNNAETALNHLRSALALYLQVGDPMEAARARALIGQVYEREGKSATSRGYYRAALKTFETLADRVNESAVLYILGRLELRENNLPVAEDYLRRSIDVTEDMRRTSTSSDLTAAFSASVHDRYETYVECLMRRHQSAPNRNFDTQAFEVSELARGRALAQLLQATQTNLAPGVDPELATREKILRQSLRAKENLKVALLAKNYRPEELAALNTDMARLEAEYREVNKSIKTRYPAYDQINRPTAWDLHQIQQQVLDDDQTLLLEYSLGESKSYVWAVTRTGFRAAELPARATVEAAAQQLYELLRNRSASAGELEITGGRLGRMLLGPVVGELATHHRVIVVADGALNYVPFQVLPVPAAGQNQLVADFEVVNAPSASILGQLRQEATRRRPPAKILAAFGDPVFFSNYAQHRNPSAGGQQLASVETTESKPWQNALRDIELQGDAIDAASIQPLFYARHELANLREVAGSETVILDGFDASRDRLQRTDLAQYAILHFATHGILDPKRPENSGLLLSMVGRNGEPQNGFVGLDDIYSLRAPVDLVVLSACRTGLGKDVRGEGLIGLTRGFMYAGASSVIASLWKVDDEATAELMKRFYTNMLQLHMAPSAALRSAQNSIRQQRQWNSPYYWAAFTFQGDDRHQISTRPPESDFAAIAVVVVTLLLVSWFGIVSWQAQRRS